MPDKKPQPTIESSAVKHATKKYPPKTKPKTLVMYILAKQKLQWTLRCMQSSSGDSKMLKKGLISQTFQISLKFWYFRIGTKKQKKGRLLHLAKNTDADYLRTDDHQDTK